MACSPENFGQVLLLAAWSPLQFTQWGSRFLTPVFPVAIALALIAAHRERDVRSDIESQVLRAYFIRRLRAVEGCGEGSEGGFFKSSGGFSDSAPGLLARHGAQPRGHVARHFSAVSGLTWSYTPSRGCGTSTGMDPSPIQRKMTSRLGSVGQRCPPVSGEGSGQGGMLMSDSHYCRAVTTSTSRIHPIRITSHWKQGAHTLGMGLSIISSTGGLR
ncbi:hypothetical protein PoB_001911800 [Plakobranchus ocellatus]|uniref:Uncharacterized protein n=1 Tax=Plakobranchus ocellatus TaxID=259542 RepID=A0AAV3ZD13_9GAST|nr:hypothetical protein PoB_001911800 [Plakobranchus ocellatus]